MGRCVSPCLGDLDPNAYRRQVDLALAHFERPGAGEALLEELDRRMGDAAADRRYERAGALLRRRERLAWVLERLEGVLRATHAAPSLVLARHPVKERFDVLWLVRGRLVDWGPLPGHSELVERTGAALARPPGRTVVPVEEVDEVRIVASWIADNEPPQLPLDPKPSAPALMRFAAGASSPRASAPPPPSGSQATAPATSAGSAAR
jgi:DNA polymerase-3 subunit epsilon